MNSAEYDLFDSSLEGKRLPLYKRMRAENPVYLSPQLMGFVLTRYQDVATVLRDPRMSVAEMTIFLDLLPSDARGEFDPLHKSLSMWMGHKRVEDHLRLQRLLKRYFTPQMVESMRPKAEKLTNQLLDAVAPQGEMETMADLAYPLPARVIAELLGVPQEDSKLLQHWSKEIAFVFQGFDLDNLRRSQKAVLEMTEYMRNIVKEHRLVPRQDIISVMIAGLEDGSVASEEELLANCILLLFAGHETTQHLIANGMLAILRNPSQLALLREQPELMPNAIEEIMRFDGPTQMTVRINNEPITLGGKEIPARSMLFLINNAANHDPEVFPDPERFDIRRKDIRHLGFGHGAFYCMGSALARMEAQVCFDALLRRFPNLRLKSEDLVKHELSPPLSRVPVSIPVLF